MCRVGGIDYTAQRGSAPSYFNELLPSHDGLKCIAGSSKPCEPSWCEWSRFAMQLMRFVAVVHVWQGQAMQCRCSAVSLSGARNGTETAKMLKEDYDELFAVGL
eukprot:4175820-Pleurochrysis_carterae.AAC.2